MICTDIIRVRDEVFFSLAVWGMLPANELSSWLTGTDQPALLPLVADGFRGDRLMRLGSMAELAHRWKLHWFEHPYFSKTGWEARLRPAFLWWRGPEGLAIGIEAVAEAERRMRQGPAHPLDAQKWADRLKQSPPSAWLTPNLIECGISAQRCEFDSRCWRVAALLVQAQRNGRALPVGNDEARAALGAHSSLLAGGPDRLTMSYQRMSPTRFRLSVDMELSTDGELTPLARYRKSSAPFGPPRQLHRPMLQDLRTQTLARIRSPAPAVRDDVPPQMSPQGGLEIWIPDPMSLAP